MKSNKISVAFYKAHYGNFQDKVIGLVTNSPYSHCEIVFFDNFCASSSPRDNGIRFKAIDLNDHWDVFEINIENLSVSIQEVFVWFYNRQNTSYDVLGAIGSAFNKDWTSSDRLFCSQACALALGLTSTIVTPQDLYYLLVDLKLI